MFYHEIKDNLVFKLLEDEHIKYYSMGPEKKQKLRPYDIDHDSEKLFYFVVGNVTIVSDTTGGLIAINKDGTSRVPLLVNFYPIDEKDVYVDENGYYCKKE